MGLELSVDVEVAVVEFYGGAATGTLTRYSTIVDEVGSEGTNEVYVTDKHQKYILKQQDRFGFLHASSEIQTGCLLGDCGTAVSGAVDFIRPISGTGQDKWTRPRRIDEADVLSGRLFKKFGDSGRRRLKPNATSIYQLDAGGHKDERRPKHIHDRWPIACPEAEDEEVSARTEGRLVKSLSRSIAHFCHRVLVESVPHLEAEACTKQDECELTTLTKDGAEAHGNEGITPIRRHF
ncbi:unnamed protein product [Dibothriocephalus latus]|uniref:Uncharacterized protein n=1 Tax=Dibothriocephalus latus TaxID=60516 RepID=A0A3P7LKL9_DIBLA|nr:unnamed protein product [Dibothriocephalus latus]